MNSETKKCILYDNKLCTHCGECEMCDLDPTKVCDNCEKCMNMDDNYNVLELDMHMEVDDESVLDDPEVFRRLNEDVEDDGNDWLSDFYNYGKNSDEDEDDNFDYDDPNKDLYDFDSTDDDFYYDNGDNYLDDYDDVDDDY